MRVGNADDSNGDSILGPEVGRAPEVDEKVVEEGEASR